MGPGWSAAVAMVSSKYSHDRHSREGGCLVMRAETAKRSDRFSAMSFANIFLGAFSTQHVHTRGYLLATSERKCLPYLLCLC